jgi:hypothetical protein
MSDSQNLTKNFFRLDKKTTFKPWREREREREKERKREREREREEKTYPTF